VVPHRAYAKLMNAQSVKKGTRDDALLVRRVMIGSIYAGSSMLAVCDIIRHCFNLCNQMWQAGSKCGNKTTVRPSVSQSTR